MDERTSESLSQLFDSLVSESSSDCFPTFNRIDNAYNEQDKPDIEQPSELSKVLIINHPDCPASSAIYTLLQMVDSPPKILKCSSAIDALCLLKMEEDVAVLFFDIDLPELQGLTLLSRVSQEFPRVQLIIHGSSTRKIPKTNISIVDRDLSPEDTTQSILETLKGETGNLHSSSLSILELMQLIEKENQSTLLDISSNGHRCRCCFEKGHLVDAIFNDKKGEESLPHIITLRDPVIKIMGMPNKKIFRRIEKTISEIIETTVFKTGKQENKSSNPITDKDSDITRIENSNHLVEAEGEQSDSPSANPHNNKEGSIMSLEEHLAKLKGINGFKAAAVMNFTGEILVSESVDPNIQLELVGATFNDIFRTAHAASEKIGLEACSETTIKTPNGLILMRCSGVKAKVHYHIIMIMAADGNQALAKMEIEKLIPVFMEELA